MSEDLIKYILSELERYCTWSKTFENLVRKGQTEWMTR